MDDLGVKCHFQNLSHNRADEKSLQLNMVCTLSPAAICSDSQQPSANTADRKPIVITSEREHGHYYLKVEPNPHAEKDSLHLLSMLCDEKGHDYPVLSLVDDNAEISDIYSPVWLASKAQCDNVRTFVLHRDTGYTYEVKLAKGVPISNDPVPDSAFK